jgi:cytochrome c
MAGLVVSPAVAAAPLTGAELFLAKGCHICHGLEGRTPLSGQYPRLAGQNVAYLLRQMADIKSGERNNGLSATMRTTLQFTSREEMERIAAYLSRLPADPVAEK